MSADDRSFAFAEARRWFDVAVDDLRVARACAALDPPALGNGAYHCQQAAEKILKGLLTASSVSFRKIHDLNELAEAVAPYYPTLVEQIDLCRPYTSWATEYRYPPEEESPPPSVETLNEAFAVIGDMLDQAQRLFA